MVPLPLLFISVFHTLFFSFSAFILLASHALIYCGRFFIFICINNLITFFHDYTTVIDGSMYVWPISKWRFVFQSPRPDVISNKT